MIKSRWEKRSFVERFFHWFGMAVRSRTPCKPNAGCPGAHIAVPLRRAARDHGLVIRRIFGVQCRQTRDLQGGEVSC
ncbi:MULTISPECIES: hypothetical protein [Paenibacillus]|uniref:hypothetical protein n=1 Tax=Paenibacillus TaxID=44249 RepID=UPI001359A987|nr:MULTISPECIES: hypothetical protein [Paenibacillus]